MKKLIFTIIAATLCFFAVQAQNTNFEKYVSKVQQSFEDKGYKLASQTIGKTCDTLPLVSDTLYLEAETYYNVVVASDNCSYCVVKLFFVDSENNMTQLEFEVIENDPEGWYNYRVYKNRNTQYGFGRYVIMVNSELPYDMSLLVYKKILPR
ncbi:MAG: hypothetical protein J5709_02740 [Bacteroidales bacterium]|nr:hypothetical protein [Bacteroidales bacterium]